MKMKKYLSLVVLGAFLAPSFALAQCLPAGPRVALTFDDGPQPRVTPADCANFGVAASSRNFLYGGKSNFA